jgi:hypothetical protein
VGDFSLTVTLDKTEAMIGDTVTATVVFKNLSDRDIEAELPDWVAKWGPIKENILSAIFTSDRDFVWMFPGVEALSRSKILIERGAVIERKFEHVITVKENLEVHAGAFCIADTDTVNPHGVDIVSGPIKIKVQ